MRHLSKWLIATMAIAVLAVGRVEAQQPDQTLGLPDCFVLAAGVDNYPNAGRLKGCLNDARNTSAAFKAQTGTLFRRVQTDVLLDGTASTSEILRKFQNFSGRGKAGDYMVLFLSGHGERTNDNKTWTFLPFDYHPKNVSTTTVTDKQILDAADVLVGQKKRVVVIVDSCFSGQMQATAQPYLNRYRSQQGGGLILMLSSGANQVSFALGEYSAFAKAFADSMTSRGDLNKDGKITLSEIQIYSPKRTAQLLTQGKVPERQDIIVAWSSSVSKDTLLAATVRLTRADPVKPPTGKAEKWTGTESLAGYGKFSFSIYPDGRVLMVDARDTVEGVWQKNDQLKQITLSFFNGAVVYTGTYNGPILSGTATGPGTPMNTKISWTWTTAQPSTGKAERWTGTESLEGYGKFSFSIYPDGRVLMVDARDTVEGVWQKNDKLKQITLSFFNGAVVYTGTYNGPTTLSGTATGPGASMDTKISWTWTTGAQP